MKKKRLLFVCCALFVANTLLLAQGRRTITGVVTGDNGKPVPSATVSIKGTTQSVVTDESGRYSITVENNNAVLIFSSVSYTQSELTVGNSNAVNASLQSLTADL